MTTSQKMDEPSVGVDPISRRELWTMVGDLTGEGIGVLWSTAYLDEAEKCDRVYLLTGPAGTTLVLEQEKTIPDPAWLVSL